MVELSLAEMMEEQRNYKLVFPAADQENEEKVVDVAKQEQKLAKEFGTTKPQDNAEENCQEKPSTEGICISMTKELLAEDKQDLIMHLLILVIALVLKQELPEVLIRRSGGLDPREVIDVRDMVEEVAIMGMEEVKQEVQQDQEYVCLKQEVQQNQKDACLKQEVRDCGGLDPGETVNKDKVEKCGFKDKVEKCGFKDKVEKCVAKDRVELKEMNMEVKQEVDVEVSKDAQVWELLCEPLFNVKFELLLAWLHMRLRFVNICKAAFNLESLLRLSDYG